MYLSFKPIKSRDNEQGKIEYYTFEGWKESQKQQTNINKKMTDEEMEEMIQKFEEADKKIFKPQKGGE